MEEKGERKVVEEGGRAQKEEERSGERKLSIVVATSPDTLNGYEMVRRAGRVGSKEGLGTSDTEYILKKRRLRKEEGDEV